MKPEDLERDIRRNPTMNERFLLGLLDETRGNTSTAVSQALQDMATVFERDGAPLAARVLRARAALHENGTY